MVLIDDAVLVAPAAVGQIFPYAPFEETFATFTTDSPIVTAGGFVATDHTVLYHLGPLDVGLPQQTLHRRRVRDDLDPSGDEVVRGGEYELLGAGCLRGSQDHLPSSSSIWAGQDELLLGGAGGVHCGDYLDLLSCLLVCHNLNALR